jgi:hypothetical protein
MGAVLSVLSIIFHTPLTIHEYLVQALIMLGERMVRLCASIFRKVLVPFTRGRQWYQNLREAREESIFMAELEKEWARSQYYYHESDSE